MFWIEYAILAAEVEAIDVYIGRVIDYQSLP